MKVKICGMTREKDIASALAAGVDYLGFNFIKQSPRCVDFEWSINMAKKYHLNRKFVSLFNTSEEKKIKKLEQILPESVLQYYGDLPFLTSLNRFYPVNATLLKQLKPNHSFNKCKDKYLVDNMDDRLGGTGKKFDWNLLHSWPLDSCMIAGGIDVEDVKVLREKGLWGVDLNSKLEISPGVKCQVKLKQLATAINE